MSWFITNLIAAFLLPPFNLLIVLLLGGLLLQRHPRLGRGLLGAGILLLYLSSTPWFAEGALHWLEKEIPPLGQQKADAIVILGGGSYFDAPEFDGQHTVSRETLLRVRYGAWLHRKTGKPILVSGGAPLGNPGSEAAQMQAVLTQEFQVPVRWQEDRSNNTLENARDSARILQAAGIRRIYLVSSAWHLPRAVAIFQRMGLEVVAAPTAFTTRYRTDLLSFLPNGSSMEKSSLFCHEMIGRLWYRLKN